MEVSGLCSNDTYTSADAFAALHTIPGTIQYNEHSISIYAEEYSVM